MSGVETITLGCRLNFAESDTMRRLAGGQDDLVIVNSCAVTAEAVRQTGKEIRRAHRRRPEARIIVTGCAAELEPARFAGMPGVWRVVGEAEKLRAASFDNAPEDAHVGAVATGGTRTRAFVGVQSGCDHRCTFCIIPHARGRSRSVPAGSVVERVQALVDGGVGEVVLTGVDLTSWGGDLPGAPGLGSLVERIMKLVPGLPRLRLSSLDSFEIDDRLFALIAGEPRLMPHLHLSLQAGDDMVLKRMKRRHSRAHAVETIARIRAARPEVAIGADLIAGFPTETEEMAANSLALVEECGIVFGHIFPYSPRPGTPAARMPQVEPEVARARAATLRAATAREKARWLESQISMNTRILVESDGLRGHAENFAEVRLDAPAAPGSIRTVRIHSATADHLLGQAQ